MRDIEKRALESQKYLQEQREKDIQDYVDGDEEFKQKAWNSYIFRLLQNHRFLSSTHAPESINFSHFRKDNKYSEVETDIDRFLPGVIKDLDGLYDENLLEIIFTLDEKAKKALELSDNISNSSYQVENTISTKTERIEGIDISNEELAEKIGDLFYDSLSSFISSLGEKLDDTEVSHLLKEASQHIMTAWEICLPYVSHDFPEMKHTTEIKGLDIDKEELAKRISNLVESELKDFLGKLSAKIYKDGKADEGRKRMKLATQLYSCAEKLKGASEKIK